jgi:hypothetical protein
MSSGADGMETWTRIVDATVPIYASYDLAKAFAVFTSPKYVLRYSIDDLEIESSGINHLVGATAGVRIGHRFGVCLETGYLKSMSSDFDAFQVNGSVFF